MNLLTQSGKLIVRTQDGAEDEFGTPKWTTVEAPVRCHLQPRESAENYPVGVSLWKGWFPADAPVDQSDAVVLADGRKFEVMGPSRLWTNPRTRRPHHIEADLKQVPA